MAVPVLYGLSRSVYTRIARLALEEKQVAYKLEEVEIFGPQGVPPEYLERHPFGRIPAFEHDGFMLYETGAITRYIDETFPGPSLQPATPRMRARMNQVIGVLDAYAYRPMIWDVFVQRVPIPKQGGTADEVVVAEALPTSAYASRHWKLCSAVNASSRARRFRSRIFTLRRYCCTSH